MKKGETWEGQVTNDFLTIITRSDLKPGYKVVQTAHALADFAVKYEQEFKSWQMGSNYLCCLEASEQKIFRVIDKLEELKIKYSIFYEPDINNEMTSIAIEAISRTQHKQLFKNLKLALHEKV